mgnify:CR=1 FL=1
MDEKQYIRARVILEVLGKPKDHVEKSMDIYLDKVKKDENLMVMKVDKSDIKEQKEQVWSIFSELELVFKKLTDMIGFCFDYMPSSVEVLKPEKLSMSNLDLASIANDLQARLHTVDMSIKKLSMENRFLKNNLNKALENSIIVLLKMNKLTSEKIAKYTGMGEEQIEPFLKKMTDKGIVIKEGGLYRLK